MNKIKKADIFVIFLIIISSFLIYIFTNKLQRGNDSSSKKVVITVDGKIFKEVELKENTNLDIDVNTQYGNNEVHIENGEVHMHESDCKDKICMKMGKISLSGDSIICLPNRLMVKIVEDKPSDDSLDMIIKWKKTQS